MSNKESISKTFIVATVLCVVCSIVVSLSAVMLRPAQLANKEQDLKRNILQAAGMYDAKQSVDAQFEHFQVRIVDLDSGKFTDAVANKSAYEGAVAAKDTGLSDELSDENDIAKIGRREKYAKVYIAKSEQGVARVVLPIRGYGLWGTLYGFIALDVDDDSVVGLGFYDHKETPGLGGEVDNEKWKALWPGKKVYDEDDDVALRVIKGKVDPGTDPNADYKVDGLSGATLTTKGVDNMLQFWLGEQGFAKFLANLKNGEA